MKSEDRTRSNELLAGPNSPEFGIRHKTFGANTLILYPYSNMSTPAAVNNTTEAPARPVQVSLWSISVDFGLVSAPVSWPADLSDAFD